MVLTTTRTCRTCNPRSYCSPSWITRSDSDGAPTPGSRRTMPDRVRSCRCPTTGFPEVHADESPSTCALACGDVGRAAGAGHGSPVASEHVRAEDRLGAVRLRHRRVPG